MLSQFLLSQKSGMKIGRCGFSDPMHKLASQKNLPVRPLVFFVRIFSDRISVVRRFNDFPGWFNLSDRQTSEVALCLIALILNVISIVPLRMWSPIATCTHADLIVVCEFARSAECVTSPLTANSSRKFENLHHFAIKCIFQILFWNSLARFTCSA